MSKITQAGDGLGMFPDGGKYHAARTRYVAWSMMAALIVTIIAVAAIAQRSPSVTIKVVDAESHQPIPEFIVTPTPSGFPAAVDLLAWDPGRSVNGTNGVLTIPFPNDSWYQLKIEAHGYLPEMAGRRANASGTITVELQKGEGYSGKVIDSDGHPVREAQVALNVKYGRLDVVGRKLTIPGWGLKVHRSTIATTDEQGQFFIPAIAGVMSLVICSEQGFAEVPKEILKTNMAVRLQPWDRSAETANNLGLYVELQTNGAPTKPGKAPELLLDIHKSNGSELLTSTNSRLRRIEIDGDWFGADVFPLASLSVLKPGASWANIPVVVDRAWNSVSPYFSSDFALLMFAPDGGWRPVGTGATRFRLTPGKHTIRMAVYAARPGLDTVGVIRAVSNPVEIEMLPDPKDAALGSFGPEIKLAMSKPTNSTPEYLNLKTGRTDATHPPGDIVWSTNGFRYALDMTTVRADIDGWDATSSEVMDALAKATPQKETIVDDPKFWNTYFFKTREGSVGMMRIQPEGFSYQIYYKLLQHEEAKK